jgi:peptide/nickel transport system substrate-binding protein
VVVTTTTAAVALAAAACRAPRAERRHDADAAPREPGGPPERGGIATAVVADYPADPTPLAARTAADRELADVLYMALVRPAWREGKRVFQTSNDTPMALAYHWEYAAPDSASIRFRMRRGVRWSDGRPVSAGDVVWTYRRLAASPVKEQVAAVDSVVAENDSTVTFHFRGRGAEMLAAASLPIAPQHAPPGDDPGRLVVSGPFRVSAWTRGQGMVLVANTAFEPRPYLDRVVLRVVPQSATRVAEARGGGADLVAEIPPANVAELQGAESARHVRLEREPRRWGRVIDWNPSHPALADAEVRRALALSVDVPALLRAQGLADFGAPSAGPAQAPTPGDTAAARPLPFDTAEAKRILDARGWRDADGDGVRDNGGKPLRFTLLVNGGEESGSAEARNLQQAWRRVGADVTVRMTGDDAFSTAVAAGRYDAALQTADAAERRLQERPRTWLYDYDGVDAVAARLRGVRPDPGGIFANPWEWWIPRGLQGGPAANDDSGKGER